MTLFDFQILLRQAFRKLRGLPPNSALVPETQDRDRAKYDWMARHEAVLSFLSTTPVDVVWIGDSIVHWFGGEPRDERLQIADDIWAKLFGPLRAINLGFGYDRTENVLWRIEHGELSGIQPKGVLVSVGTNNLVVNTVEQTCEGIVAVVEAVRRAVPDAEILLLGLLPRDVAPSSPVRKKVRLVNEILATRCPAGVVFLDLGGALLDEDGALTSAMAADGLHPTRAGYEALATALKPSISKWSP